MFNQVNMPAYSTEDKRQALTSAAHWYALLCADDVSVKDKAEWQVWLTGVEDSDNSDDTNEQQVFLNQWAWQQVEHLQSNLQQIPKKVPNNLVVNSLSKVDGHFKQERRMAMRSLMVILGTGTVAWLGYRNEITNISDIVMADQRSKTGEVRTLLLADGSQVILNTASAIDIQFSNTERRIVLRHGDIMVETAKAQTTDNIPAINDSRPFIVETAHGDIQALGTRFSVRELDDKTQVNVYQHSVRVTNNIGIQQLCPAASSLNFNESEISTIKTHTISDAWTEHMLVVTDMPLTDFINEVSRYRAGILRCNNKLAKHRISGAFNTQDTEQILRALEKSFPVKVNSLTRYWVNISPSP